MRQLLQFQVFLYVLHIIYVIVQTNIIDIEENGTVENPRDILFYDYIEYVTSTYAPLLNDYRKDKDSYGSINNETRSNFTDVFQIVATVSNQEKNDASTCNVADRRIVRNLTVDKVSTEWIYFSWQSPCETPINETFFYMIEIVSPRQHIEKNTTGIQFNVTDLHPCSTYNISVKVVGEDWETNGVQIAAATSYNISEIGDIRELGVHTTTNSISLIWRAPTINSICVHSYLITQCSNGICNNVTVNREEYVSTGLEPCQQYYFVIKSVAHFKQSVGVNITLKTNSPKPSKPMNPIVEASAFSLFVNWQEPEVGAMCIKHYLITVNPQNMTKQLTGTSATINNLYACTIYVVSINAVDEDNNNGEVITIPTKTAPTVSMSPKLSNENPIITMNSVMLSWKIEKGNSNCTLNFLKAVCNSTSSNGHGYDPQNGEAKEIIDSRIQDKFLIVNSLIEHISPYTNYICWSYVVNEAGNSELSNLISVTTAEDLPSPPLFNVENVTYSQFLFTWKSPTYLAGNLTEFEIVIEYDVRFPIPYWCNQIPLRIVKSLNGSTFSLEYLEAKAYAFYRAKIKARTNAGWSNYSEELIFHTPAGVPGVVSNFTYVIETNEQNQNALDTILSWRSPCSLNGILEYYNVIAYGTRTNYPPHFIEFRQYISNDITINDTISINIEELKAEYNYTLNISAKVERVQEFGLASSQHVLYPAGIPPQPDKDYVKLITINPGNTKRSTSTVTLLLPVFQDTNGKVRYYSIMVSRKEYNVPSSARYDITKHKWPNISSWEESMLHDFIIPYQATRLWWDPYPNSVADYGDVKAVKYTLGEDTSCQEMSSNINKKVYCNGPLKPNTWYHVRMRAYTNGGYSDSTTFLIKTNAEIDVGLVGGVVFGILLLGILTTMMLLIRKCSPQVLLRRFLHSDMSGSPVPTPFSKKKFLSHCQQLIDNPGKLSNEFQLLQTLSVDLQMPANTACLQANKKKNRYSDILPYDFSRVKLEVVDNDPYTDYINASFIKGFSGEDEYIACQGPKEETTFDFWRMIEQYNVNIIVMLTELLEKGKEKCHQYYPTIRETFKYENMTIRCITELDYRSYTQRTFTLLKDGRRRNVIHLHFKEWPDHDVPEDFDPMIHFCQIVRRHILANKGYMVIHCSAGIGRTGTFIAIDILLQNIRDNRKLDVFGTVYRLRHDRINMVQNESQYAYIYNCIKQILKNPYCLKNYKPPPMDPLSSEGTSRKTKILPCSNIDLVNSCELCTYCLLFAIYIYKIIYILFLAIGRKCSLT